MKSRICGQCGRGLEIDETICAGCKTPWKAYTSLEHIKLSSKNSLLNLLFILTGIILVFPMLYLLFNAFLCSVALIVGLLKYLAGGTY